MHIEIPAEFPVPFPARINRFTGRVSQQFWQWVQEQDLAPTARSRERLRRSGIELASCYCWPWADRSVLLEGMKWMFFFFRFDDQMEEGAAQRDVSRVQKAADKITGILHNQALTTTSPLARELHRTWQRTQADRPLSWVEAFRDHYCELVRSYTRQSRFNYDTDRHGRVLGLSEYEDFRETAFGMDWVYDFMETSGPRGSYLPAELRSCRPMLRLRRAASLQQALLNDIFSAAREDHQDRTVNSVMIFRHTRQCTPQQAVRQVVDRIDHHLADYRQACADMRSLCHERGFEPPVTRAVMQFIKNIDAVIGGNHDWHHIVMRYATDDVTAAQGAYTYPDDL
ncbi:hypothetical protein FM076_00225 [Streptomyces albus subsp. chlorinus]|uniref:terpene synthase family protein n=1 Tax=Streptomyces albus TaxID=1888 RepID=UPI001570AC32|nr:hypothetical protein [Streptomyces albus]NSC19737.1 hypothetical protein [Streptomyces albus subsp. chlorinus]